MTTKTIGCIAAAMVWLLASCSNDINPNHEINNGDNSSDSEFVEVVFNVSAMGDVLSRGELPGGPGQWQTISRGAKIDMLVYAVYDDETAAGNSEGFTLLTQYAQGLVDTNGAPTTWWGDAEAEPDLTGDEHKGQTIMNVTGVFENGGSQKVTLRLMRNKNYHIAFWAQSSQTDAFDFADLEKVEVKYRKADGTNYNNNDEYRDAFCKVHSFSVTPVASTYSVVLTRPFAQLNIGTSAYDFNNLVQTEYPEDPLDPDGNFVLAYSRIRVDGAYRFYNVLKANTLRNGEQGVTAETEKTSAYFDYAVIPAYINDSQLPDDFFTTTDSDEEFLCVDWNNDGNIDKNYGFATLPTDITSVERYKYLSMCYLLVNDYRTSDYEYDENGQMVGTDASEYAGTLEGIEFHMTKHHDDEAINEFILKIDTKIPVQRNWRTNLLSTNILTEKVLYRNPNFTFLVETGFDGEYDTPDLGGNWEVNNK